MEMLKNRGLLFDDEQAAVECLKIISYFRLANYWKPMESDKVNHVFKPKSKFENVVTLYNFDKELRTLIFSAIQSIEIELAALGDGRGGKCLEHGRRKLGRNVIPNVAIGLELGIRDRVDMHVRSCSFV